jgi:hypothetical protein
MAVASVQRSSAAARLDRRSWLHGAYQLGGIDYPIELLFGDQARLERHFLEREIVVHRAMRFYSLS